MHGDGVPVPLSGYGGLVTLADPTSVPEGASPRTYDTDFLVGQVQTRAGLSAVYVKQDTQIGPNLPTTVTTGGTQLISTGPPLKIDLYSAWASPSSLLATDGSFASFSPVNTLNRINPAGYTFNVPSTSGVTGVTLTLHGFSNVPASVTAQLLINGKPQGAIKTLVMPQTTGSVSTGSATDSWDLLLSPDICNALDFGVQLIAISTGYDSATVFLDSASLELGLQTGTSNFQYVGTFTSQAGDVKNISMDANGNLYVEDATNSPGTQALVMEGITTDSHIVSVNGPDVAYLAITDGSTGSDMPLQYTANWIDRITQVGPGAAPSFAPAQATSNTFAITSITQPPANSDVTDPGHISVLLWSAGPGSTAPGNVLTVYYSPSFFSGAPQPSAEDTTLVNLFNSGYATYVYIDVAGVFTGTALVTSVGNALPPGVDHWRYYFTVNMTTTSYQNIEEATGTYQITAATLTTAVPVPGLTVGNNVTIASASVPAWDATWPITQALNSASMVITQTSVTASVATYDYTVSTGAPPAAGELVTVTGTTNANGALNLTNATIASATGGTSGSFTISVSVVTAAAAPEDGQATTAGTIFTIDPGLADAGTATNPILGNSTGGTLTFTGAAAQLIGPGTRQGTVFFITRNGYYTCPAPPVTFTCPENTTAILASNIPVGPPNVVARGIAFTEAGQNGVPGANFFTIPIPVTYIVNNTPYTATALIINDNTTTSASFQFTDPVLLNAEAIDIYGYNLFNQIEIGDPGWIAKYGSRIAYGLCRNKVQNFVNLSFDGGFNPPVQQQAQVFPLGWSTPDIYGTLVTSAKFGNAYYIQNTSTGALSVAGLISQTAYQDAYKEPIIQPNTAYSVRVGARIPSGITTGNLDVALVAGGISYGEFTLPFASMKSSYGVFEGTLLTNTLATIPPDLMLQVSATDLAANADLEIDRVEIYPTAIPVLTTTVFFSYAGLPEQVDSVTGAVVFTSENQQAVNGAIVLYDTFYALKGWLGKTPGSSLYSLQKASNLEPAQWDEPEVAQRAGGSVGVLAFDSGEQWFVGASRAGLYLFVGGQPGKISQEVYQLWDAINWKHGDSIWVKVDIDARRIFIGVPMATPNFWLPYAPINANPTTPSVILMCNYQGLDSGEALKASPQMHTTMFGTLNAIDMRRKWSIWQVPSPYANIVQGASDEQIYICNGNGSSKIYLLDDAATTDDGAIIDSLYTTAGLPETSKRAQMPQLGRGRVRWDYMTAALTSDGLVNVKLYANRLFQDGSAPSGYQWWQIPGGFAPGDGLDDVESSLNFVARRTFFEFRENDGYGFTLSNLVPYGKQDIWNRFTGKKTQ